MNEFTIKEAGIPATDTEARAIGLVLKQLDKVLRWGKIPAIKGTDRDSVAEHTLKAIHLAEDTIKQNPNLLMAVRRMLLVHDFGEIIEEFAQGQIETKEEKISRHQLEDRLAREALQLAFAEAEGQVPVGSFDRAVKYARETKSLTLLRGDEKISTSAECNKWLLTYNEVENIEARKENPAALLSKLLDKLEGHIKFKKSSYGFRSLDSEMRLKKFQEKISRDSDNIVKIKGGAAALNAIKKKLKATWATGWKEQHTQFLSLLGIKQKNAA